MISVCGVLEICCLTWSVKLSQAGILCHDTVRLPKALMRVACTDLYLFFYTFIGRGHWCDGGLYGEQAILDTSHYFYVAKGYGQGGILSS